MKHLLVVSLIVSSCNLFAQPLNHIFKFGLSGGWWRMAPQVNYELFKKRTSLDIQFEAGMPSWRRIQLREKNVNLIDDHLCTVNQSFYYYDLFGGTHNYNQLPIRDTKYYGITLNIAGKIYFWLNGRERGWPEGAWLKAGLATALYAYTDYFIIKKEAGIKERKQADIWGNRFKSEFTFGPVLQLGYSLSNRWKRYTVDISIACPFYIPLSMFKENSNIGIGEFSIQDPLIGSKPFLNLVIGGDLNDIKKWTKKRKRR